MVRYELRTFTNIRTVRTFVRFCSSYPKGLTIVEALVGIALVGAMLVAFGTISSTRRLHKHARDITIAVALAEEINEAVRNLPSAEVTNRTNAPPIGITMNAGLWEVSATSSAPSQPHAVNVIASDSAISGVTALLLLPTDAQGDGTTQAALMAQASSPAGWRAGLGIHGRDTETMYRYTYGANDLTFERVQSGTATTLWSTSVASSLGTFYTLAVTVSGNTFQLSRNGVVLATISDTMYRFGDISLLGMNGAVAVADDISAPGMSIESFDDESAGLIPPPWRRLTPRDLPQGAVELTIEDAFAGGSLKKITARARWQGSRGAEQLEAVTYTQ